LTVLPYLAMFNQRTMLHVQTSNISVLMSILLIDFIQGLFISHC